MRKYKRIIVLILTAILLFTGCQPSAVGNNSNNTDNGTKGNQNIEDDNIRDDVVKDNSEVDTSYEFTAEVIEAGDHLLVAPDKESNEYRSSDKISVSTINSVIIDKEGKEITPAELNPGDMLKITYNGMIAESYPAQITASKIEVTGHNQLIDGYLALIDDIWQEDQGLNNDVEMIAFDTTGWIEVSDVEKEIILAEVKKKYGYDVIQGTFEELSEQGLINEDDLYFPNGVLITINKMEVSGKKDKITCSIQKWRSGLGAIGSDDATAKYKKGKWTITKEGMWIS